MSRRRYISTDISTDPKIAELAEYGPLPLLLYTWAIPHMDDWGRMTGDARQFKLLVCPALDVTAAQVDEALDQIASVGLWVRYEVDGRKYIAVPEAAWFKHQTYINKSKRKEDKSQFPPPPNTEHHRKTPQNTEEQHKVARSAEQQRETPQNTASPSPSPTPSEIQTAAAIESAYEAQREAAATNGDSPLPPSSDFQDSEVYPPSVFDAIEQRMCVRMGKPSYTLVGTEFAAAKSVMDAGVPLDFVLQGVDWAFERYKPKHPGDKISSFAYCKPIILELWQAQQERKDAKVTPISATGPPKTPTYGRAIVNEPDPTVEWAKEFLRQEAKASGLDSS